jgi:hypothetical protein
MFMSPEFLELMKTELRRQCDEILRPRFEAAFADFDYQSLYMTVKYPLECGCHGSSYISKCVKHQLEDIDHQRAQMGMLTPNKESDVHTIPQFPNDPHHISSSGCWCAPERIYVHPESGFGHWLHKRLS